MILLTGAAGLIGSAVARELNSRGVDDLVLVDHLGNSSKWKNLRSLQYHQYFEKDAFRGLIKSFLSNQTPIELDFGKLTTIIHLGANSSTTELDASHLMDNNYRYSIDLANLARKLGIRMVYASSAATYGDGDLGFVDNLDVLDSLRPLNGYGYSKHAFDQYLQKTGFHGFAGIKYFNVFGPNEYHKGDMRSVVHKAFEQIQSHGRVSLFKSYKPEYKDGEQQRDFLYVKDAARMTVYLALEKPGVDGLFNAGSGQAASWNDLVGNIFKALQIQPQIDYIDMPEGLRQKYQYYTCASIQKMRSAGFSQEITGLDVAVHDYVCTYLKNDDPYA